MDSNDDRRDAVTSADDTGLIAGEQLVAQGEMLAPLQRPFPHEDLHAALPAEHAAHKTIDDLRAETESAKPDARSIKAHVTSLWSIPELEARVSTWFEDPGTQRFIGMIDRMGL